jgi:hypothetical protein
MAWVFTETFCRAAALLLSVGAAACAGSTGPLLNEYLDEHTGAHLAVVGRPLTFALERSTLAANARDYVSLAAAEVDRSGHAQTYLIGYFWSTIDRRKSAAGFAPADLTVALFADGRWLRLAPESKIPDDLAASPHLLAPPAAAAVEAVYRVTAEQLRYLGESRSLILHIAAAAEDDPDAEPYALWTDGRRELKAFNRSIATP